MKSFLSLFGTAAALVAVSGPLRARDPLHLVDFTPVGEWPVVMPDAAVTVRGHRAFVTQWHPETLLRIFDVRDPTHPVVAGKVSLPAGHILEEILVAGQHAYVRFSAPETYSGGFHVIDVRDTAHPVLTGSYFPTDERITAIATHGRCVCVGAYRGWDSGEPAEFRVIDVSNPANPVAVGECPLADGGPIDIAISENRAYLAHYDSLVAVNLDNPQQPEVIGRYEFPPAPAGVVGAIPVGVVVAGDHAFVATRSGPWFFREQEPGRAGLEVIDISDPARPAPAGRYLCRDGFSGVTLAEGHVVAFTRFPDMGTGVLVFDVSDAARPRRVDRGNLSTASSAGIAVANNHLFVPGAGIYRIEKLSPASPIMELRLNPLTAAPELMVNFQGYDDFTLMTSGSLREWQPWATVYSRLREFKLMPDGSRPAKEARRFYRTAEAVSPEEMTLQWEAVRPDNYRFRFEHIESAGQAVLTAIVEVNRWRIHRIYDARLNGEPLGSTYDYRFTTPDELFWKLLRIRSSTDLVIVKQDATLPYPTWVYIDPSAQTAGDEVTIRMTDLEEVGVVVDLPPGD